MECQSNASGSLFWIIQVVQWKQWHVSKELKHLGDMSSKPTQKSSREFSELMLWNCRFFFGSIFDHGFLMFSTVWVLFSLKDGNQKLLSGACSAPLPTLSEVHQTTFHASELSSLGSCCQRMRLVVVVMHHVSILIAAIHMKSSSMLSPVMTQ